MGNRSGGQPQAGAGSRRRDCSERTHNVRIARAGQRRPTSCAVAFTRSSPSPGLLVASAAPGSFFLASSSIVLRPLRLRLPCPSSCWVGCFCSPGASGTRKLLLSSGRWESFSFQSSSFSSEERAFDTTVGRRLLLLRTPSRGCCREEFLTRRCEEAIIPVPRVAESTRPIIRLCGHMPAPRAHSCRRHDRNS